MATATAFLPKTPMPAVAKTRECVSGQKIKKQLSAKSKNN